MGNILEKLSGVRFFKFSIKSQKNTKFGGNMQVRKQQLELDMEQQTGSKQEKEYVNFKDKCYSI